MKSSLHAAANRGFFANRKDRRIVRKAKTNYHALLHARAAHAFSVLCGSLRGLWRAATASADTDAMARPAIGSKRFTRTWMPGMQPCSVVVRRQSPVVVVA
jgi:hypothetical protein